MAPCLHIDPSGRRCRAPAAEGSIYCPHHDPDSAVPSPLRLWSFRLAALFLLLFFLFELYLNLREVMR